MTSEQTKVSPVQKARQLLQQKQIDQGIELLNRYLAVEPRDRDAHELLGMAWFMTKKYEEAKAAFERLTVVAPKYSAGWVNLGAVQNVMKEHQAATKSLRKAIKFDTKSASAYYNLGIAQKALKLNSMAISAYREAIKLNPAMEEPYVNLANIYVEMTNLIQARKTLDQGLLHCPHSAKLKAVKQKAEQLEAGKRNSSSPFGRLVNEEELARKQIRTTKRDLTPNERNDERDTLKALGKAIRALSEPTIQHLNGTLHEQLHLLTLFAAQRDDRGDAPGAFDAMTTTLAELDQMRAETAKSIGEIRTHLQRTDPGL